jgi:hypothetical protein
LVAPAYDWWFNLHRDNPSEQELWKTKFFDGLWKPHDYSRYLGLSVLEEIRRTEEDGYYALINMEAFCRERVEELIKNKGLKVDWQSRPKIEKRSGRRFSEPVWTSPS